MPIKPQMPMLQLRMLVNIISNDQEQHVIIKTIDEVCFCFRGYQSKCILSAARSSMWDSTIRVYIGCEYECPRGHRFLCASPNHVIRVGPNGSVKVCLSSHQDIHLLSFIRMTEQN